MKFIRFVSFFLLVISYCSSYANENKYIFVGQNESDELMKTAFVLELMGDDLEQYVKITENGEVYLKVDKIVAIPKETVSQFAFLTGNGGTPQPNEAQNAAGISFCAVNAQQYSFEEPEIRCKKCYYYFSPRPGHRNCPRCGTPN